MAGLFQIPARDFKSDPLPDAGRRRTASPGMVCRYSNYDDVMDVKLVKQASYRGVVGSAQLPDGSLVQIGIPDTQWDLVFPGHTVDPGDPIAIRAAWQAALEDPWTGFTDPPGRRRVEARHIQTAAVR